LVATWRMKGIMALCRFCGPQRAGAARSAAERRPFFNFECCCRLFTSLLKTSPFLIEVILHTSFILFTGKRKPLAARRPKVPPGPATSYATRSLASSLLKTSIFIIFCTRAMANIDGNAARNGTNTYCKLGNPRAQPLTIYGFIGKNPVTAHANCRACCANYRRTDR